MNQARVEPVWRSRLSQSPIINFHIGHELLLATAQNPGNEPAPAYLYAVDSVTGELKWSHQFENVVLTGLHLYSKPNDGLWIFVTASNQDFFLDEVSVTCFDQQGNQRWRWLGESQTISDASHMANRLSFTINSELFIQLDVDSGKELHRIPLPTPASFSAPKCEADAVYIPGRGPYLMALNKEGRLLWQFHEEGLGWLDKTPEIAEARILTVGRKGHLLALNAATGTLLWQLDIGPAGRALSSPVITGQLAVVGATDGVHAIDIEKGQSIWTFKTERSVTAQPVIHHQIVYAACRDHTIYALKANNGQEVWRYKMDRYIELSPRIREGENGRLPTVYAVDRGGQMVALQQRLSAPSESHTALSPQKRPSITERIEQLESDGDLTRAAEAWYEKGDLERASEQFELAGKWLRAADIWQQLGRLHKYAQALEGHARTVEDRAGHIEERIAAWREAAKAYLGEGEKAKFEFCQRKIAEYEQQPILDLTIEHDGLVLNIWSKLKLTVFNTGFGTARRIDINASGEQFRGQVASSKIFFKLRPNKKLEVLLTVRPLQYGDSVPLKLTLDYQDNKMKLQRLEKTIIVAVAREQSQRVVGQIPNVFTTEVRSGKIVKPPPSTEIDLVGLRRNLAVSFNINDLQDLCFQLKIDTEELIRERKSEFIREIILYLERRGRLKELIAICESERPHIDWSA